MESKNKQKLSLKVQRVFSVEIRRKTVRDVERGKCTILQASNELGVSQGSIYKWINQYSLYLKQSKRMVVEDKSEAYRSKELENKLKEVEAMLGRKQMEIEFLNKMIEIANEEFKIDIKQSVKKDFRMVSNQQRNKT
ncbi:MAG: transposase [Saprospiraceae bacterium]|nr:transposase [Saprospiraceae bacterium]MBK9109746.1 transposase [Saprospiraceae bacterium]